MRCRHCRSQMQQIDSVTEGRARQVWYRCPLCASRQTVSHPYEARLRRMGKLQRRSAGANGAGPRTLLSASQTTSPAEGIGIGK